jgi:competence protein ComEC
VVIGCDVGQGDAVLLRSGDTSAVLVDTGPEPDLVRRCLRDAGVERLDALVLSHFHADHVAGVAGVVEAVPITLAYVSPVREPAPGASQTLEDLSSAAVPVVEGLAGATFSAGGAQVEILSPGERPVVGGSAANNGSLVLDVQIDGRRILLTWDIEPEAARPLRQLVGERDYDVLKVAHHGSAHQDALLVEASRAEVAVIGVGADNDFGHPAPRTLDLLRTSGMLVLRTDTDGDVAVTTEAGTLVTYRRGP